MTPEQKQIIADRPRAQTVEALPEVQRIAAEESERFIRDAACFGIIVQPTGELDMVPDTEEVDLDVIF